MSGESIPSPSDAEVKETSKTHKSTHSISFNVVMNMVLTSSKFIFPLITVPYASRILSTYGMGAVSFSQSVANYFGLAAVLGMTNYGIATCAKVRNDPYELSATLRELLTILSVSTFVSCLVYLCACFVVPRFSEDRSLFLLFGTTIFLTSMGVEWLYQALEQYTYITVRSIIFKFVGLILMFVLVRNTNDYLLYGVTVIVSGYLSNVLNMMRLRRFLAPIPTRKVHPSKHLKPMLWFSVASVSSGMYTQVDIVLLGFLGTTSMVGLYQLVSKVRGLVITAMNSVGNVILPRISYYVAQDMEDNVIRLVGKNIAFVLLAASAWLSLSILCAEQIVEILGGEDFVDAAMPLMLASPSVVFSALNIALGGYLISHGREREWSFINVIGLMLAAVYDMLLIPVFGAAGSAIGVSLTEASILVMRSLRCKSVVQRALKSSGISKIIAASIVGLTVCLFVKDFVYPTGSLVTLLVISLSFFAIYLTTLTVLRHKFVLDQLRRLPFLRDLVS